MCAKAKACGHTHSRSMCSLLWHRRLEGLVVTKKSDGRVRRPKLILTNPDIPMSAKNSCIHNVIGAQLEVAGKQLIGQPPQLNFPHCRAGVLQALLSCLVVGGIRRTRSVSVGSACIVWDTLLPHISLFACVHLCCP